jgi:hypothetical protein
LTNPTNARQTRKLRGLAYRVGLDRERQFARDQGASTDQSTHGAGLLLHVTAAILSGVLQARAAVPMQLVYRVLHSLVGELGS